MQTKQTPKKSLKLYWVTDNADCENWFVIARSPKSAKRFYEDSEGMDSECDEIEAEYVITIPNELYKKHYMDEEAPTHAQIPILLDLGFKILSSENSNRVLEFRGKVYGEGDYFLDDEKGGDLVDDDDDDDETRAEFQDNQTLQNKLNKVKGKEEEEEKEDDKGLKLYWVTDLADSESWFVMAKTKNNAQKFYAEYETLDSYNYGIDAEEIMEIPVEVFKKHYNGEKTPIHAQIPILIEMGFKLISPEKNITKVVEYKGRRFCEGVTQMMIDYKGNVDLIMKELQCYPKMPKIMEEALKDPKNMKHYSNGLYRLYR